MVFAEPRDNRLLKSRGLRGAASIRSRIEETLRLPRPFSPPDEWKQAPARLVVNYILGCLFHPETSVKWKAVTALGWIVNRMAEENLESARNIMRRLMWSLNDESGGIGWGSAETMGEIMAVNGDLAREYHCILLSYVQERGNPLENPLLERGVLWGIGRLAMVRPDLVKGCASHLIPFLRSPDPVHRGHALWALGFVEEPVPDDLVEVLMRDATPIELYDGRELQSVRIEELARRCRTGRSGCLLYTSPSPRDS